MAIGNDITGKFGNSVYNPGSVLGGLDMASEMQGRLMLSEAAYGQDARKADYTVDIRFVDGKVILMVRSKHNPQYTEYIGDSIEHAMEKIKAHMVKERMNLNKPQNSAQEKAA